jgi:hypothetical protein
MKKSTFLEKTSNACFQNANQFIEDAEILCSFRSYGHALAFKILGDVEMGKAMMYYLFSKNLIPETTLPKPFSSYYLNNEYDQFAAEAWWIGFVIISNIEEVLQNLIEITEEVDLDPEGEFGIKLTKKGRELQQKLIQLMSKENVKIKEIDSNISEVFLVQSKFQTKEIRTPNQIKKNKVKESIKSAKKKIKTIEPFRNLPLNSIQQKLTKMLLTIAFQSILPLKNEIIHCLVPSTPKYIYK